MFNRGPCESPCTEPKHSSVPRNARVEDFSRHRTSEIALDIIGRGTRTPDLLRVNCLGALFAIDRR